MKLLAVLILIFYIAIYVNISVNTEAAIYNLQRMLTDDENIIVHKLRGGSAIATAILTFVVLIIIFFL